MSIQKKDVYRLLVDIMDNVPCWQVEDSEAKANLAYIAGARDMALSVIEAIEDSQHPTQNARQGGTQIEKNKELEVHE